MKEATRGQVSQVKLISVHPRVTGASASIFIYQMSSETNISRNGHELNPEAMPHCGETHPELIAQPHYIYIYMKGLIDWNDSRCSNELLNDTF